jgi:hypothetical protein
MSKTKTTVKDVTNWMLHLFVARGEPLKCGICGQPMLPDDPIHWDHVHCEALDGPHHFTNLRPTHKACNLKKGGRETKALHKIDRITGVTGNGPKKRIASKPFQKRTQPYVWPKRSMRRYERKTT